MTPADARAVREVHVEACKIVADHWQLLGLSRPRGVIVECPTWVERLKRAGGYSLATLPLSDPDGRIVPSVEV